jgi:SAM-dependent methyltransferase
MIAMDVATAEPIAECLQESEPARTHVMANACIYCGGDQFWPLYSGIRDRLGFVSGDWMFLKCAHCEAALLAPQPASEELGSFYPSVYTFAPQTTEQSVVRRFLSNIEYRCLYQPMYASQAKQIARLTEGASGQRLLDIGCGRGLRLLELRRLGFDVHGVDFDPAAVDYLQSKHSIPAESCDVLRLEDRFADGSFDVITAYYVVEHVVELERLLVSCFNLLRPGGTLVAAVPLIDGLQQKIFGRRWCQVTEAPRHVSLPSVRAMQGALMNVGFANIRLESDSFLLTASSAALSVVSSGTTHSAYGEASLAAFAKRVLAIGAAVASLPLSIWESSISGCPSLGVFAARRPE